MSVICDECERHVAKRFFIKGKDYTNSLLDIYGQQEKSEIPLVSIPTERLKTMSVETLEKIYRFAQEGAMVCEDCMYLCSVGDPGCTKERRGHLINKKDTYNFRLRTEDKTVKEQILAELKRRIKVKEAYEATLKSRR